MGKFGSIPNCIQFICCNRKLETICVTLGYVNIFIRMLYYFVFKFIMLMSLLQYSGGLEFIYAFAIFVPDVIAIKADMNLILGAKQKNLELIKTYLFLVIVYCGTNLVVQIFMVYVYENYDIFAIESIILGFDIVCCFFAFHMYHSWKNVYHSNVASVSIVSYVNTGHGSQSGTKDVSQILYKTFENP